MDSLSRDFRHAFRRLFAAPGFAATAILTLALGVGATTSIYSVVDALLLRPLPYREADSLFKALNVFESGQRTDSLAYDKFIEWKEQRDIFEVVEPYSARTFTLAGSGDPRMIFAVEVGGGVMGLLGMPAARGRTIQPEDAQQGRDVVVLGDPLWRSAFGADPAIVGKAIRLDDRTFEVVGVMPPAFRFPARVHELWTPAPLVAERSGRPAAYSALVKLRPGLGRERAQERADTIAAALTTQKPRQGGWRIDIRPLRAMNPRERTALLVLFGAVAFVLLIACANIANLLLVQGAGREREMAVRGALGASRGRLVRQLLAETLLLACAGGVLGIILSWQAVQLLAAYTPRSLTFLNANDIALDWRVIAFAVAVTLGTVFGFGLMPALRTSRTALHESLKAGTRTSTDSPKLEYLRRAFVVGQLALTLVLLIGAGLLVRTFSTIVRADPGFEAEKLVTASLVLPRWKYPDVASQRAYYDQVIERLRALPGVEAATVAGGAPPTGGGISFDLAFEIEGRGVVLEDPRLILPIASVPAEYFSVLGIPLRAGRSFIPADHTSPPSSIVISETMARELWKGENPLGSRLRMSADWPWYTVVGVVGDVYQFEHTRPQGQFAAYYPIGSGRGAQLAIIVRTARDPEGMVAAIQRQIWTVDPDQPILSIATVRDRYAEFFDTPRFYAVLMGAFAAIGLIIAAVGLYGVLAYSMAQRTREFGIRMALGAERRDVIRMVLRAGGLLIAAGLLIGAAGSLLVTRSLEAMLVNVPRTDVITYAVVLGTLALTGLAATWIPARRATRIDPVVALRAE